MKKHPPYQTHRDNLDEEFFENWRPEKSDPSIRRKTCLKCKSDEYVLPVLWGMPASAPILETRVVDGLEKTLCPDGSEFCGERVTYGGCVIGEVARKWDCTRCLIHFN